jgi:ParB-like chromosome segregation protein Spo0J
MRKAKSAMDLSHISPGLQRLAVPVRDLWPDPKNARRHDDRNLEAIAASLRRFGQQAPVVFVRRGRRKVVLKGSGLLKAASRILHWRTVAAVESGLGGADATAYAIADNRTTDLSEFDEELLAAQLKELQDTKFDLEASGFNEDEFQELLKSLEDGDTSDAEDRKRAKGKAAARARKVSELFSVIVECKNEREQLAFYRRMQKEGRRCKLYVL